MSPELLKGNKIRLYENESITGEGGTVKGRRTAQVYFHSDMIEIHTGPKDIYIKGTTIEDVLTSVRKI